MELLIDNRESIKDRIHKETPDINIQFANLSLGDYIFKLKVVEFYFGVPLSF